MKKTKAERRRSNEAIKRARQKKETSIRELIPNIIFSMKYIYKANRALYFVRFPLLLLQTAENLLPILFVRKILNTLTVDKDLKWVMIYVALMAVSICAVKIVLRLLGNFDARQLEKTMYRIKRNLGEAVMELPYDALETPKMRDFVSLAEYNRLGEMLIYFTGFLGALINVLSLSAIIVTIHPLILLLLAVVTTFKILIDKARRKQYYRWRGEYAPVTRKLGYYADIMHGVEYGKEVRANSLEDWLIERYKKISKEEYEPIYKANGKRNVRFDTLVSSSNIIQEAVIYLVLAHKVVFSGMLIGDFSMYLTSVSKFANSVAGVTGGFSSLMTCGLFAKDFRYCLNESAKFKKKSSIGHAGIREIEKIEFKNVSFAYPNTDKLVLKGINLTLSKNESLSIVGLNGAGKTTFVKLLCRLYEPTDGEILINGKPIKEISFEEYIKLISVVFQDFKLFSFSVKENVQMNTEGNPEKVDRAIIESGLEEKIASLPKGKDTYVYKEFDSEGVEFSGGEGQKLAIARAIYKDAQIVILDEPTSALDPIAEYDVYSHFHSLSEGKLSIYISHRLSSTRFTNKIALFDDGVIKEYGSHSELISIENGIYRNMFETQANLYI